MKRDHDDAGLGLDPDLGWGTKLAIAASFVFTLAITVAIFGPIVLVMWKFAFWVLP